MSALSWRKASPSNDIPFGSWRQSCLKTEVQMGLVRAIAGKLIAIHLEKPDMVVAAEQYIAGFRNLLTEMDAAGTQRKFAPGRVIELKNPTGTDGIVAGWASTPDRDAYGHEVVNGAFSDAIRKRGLTGPSAIKLLLDHDWTKPAGLIRTLEYRSKGLWLEAQLNLDIEYVRDRYSAMKMLGGFNFSVGFLLEDYEIKTDPNKRGYLQVNRGDLFEVSAVAFPANEAATLHEIKSGDALDDAVSKFRTQVAEMKRVLKGH